IFVALKGARSDGFDYHHEAVSRGTNIILCDVNHPYQEAQDKYPDVLFIPVPQPRYHFSLILRRLNDQMPLHIAAVTGTNGKTSVADFTRQILTYMGLKAVSIGTIGIIAGQQKIIQHGHTTPDPEMLYPTLKQLKKDGFEYIIFEASSHGLAQFRLHGLDCKVGGFTNFSRDHLDYHATEDAYFAAKQLLFDDLVTRKGHAVIYKDDARSEDMQNAALRNELSVTTIGQNADISITKIEPTLSGQTIYVSYAGQEYDINLSLCGTFQASNALIAAAMAARLMDKDFVDILPLLRKLKTVDGRMDLIGYHHGAAVYVDYAHTPDALEKAITALRPHCERRLLTLFGCGGDRDRGKRPEMGHIAESLSDYVIITDDNPRTEDPNHIHTDILKGCVTTDKISVIANREDALVFALNMLSEGDILLVAGKGHESGQDIGGIMHPFKDATVIRDIMQRAA
ncbi:MAG: UDP-N-acetylmuramoyl-L-alanyl-D-glutamate--2,6-diaminopimelate ligase, partial [Pseudomonadota bacterium]